MGNLCFQQQVKLPSIQDHLGAAAATKVVVLLAERVLRRAHRRMGGARRTPVLDTATGRVNAGSNPAGHCRL
ncbi:Os11g0259501 [Oryza sativa Japonica Group]|uniref:Os11g0259501 protein n=1 Tax=Oryza sativa subsp. japonica TaxID=39947 RepID=A0A0N7KSQ7_ORYSJ|nr:Os11g0259501 [Oryza sativa Japonica Group]